MNEITHILSQVEQGDPRAAEQLLPLVYGELRKLAAERLKQEKPGQTLQATALVHEAYLRLVDGDAAREWNGRRHFFGAAAEAMRRILVENARRKKRPKHGGDRQRVELADAPEESRDDPILALNEALPRLAEHDALAAEVFRLRYFAGLTHAQVVADLGLTMYAAREKWDYARAWLTDVLEPR